ncbi:hypothetical protein SARC_03608 [Sphaeroforma arctica JP610]|uniref:Uncharacterized protein n=1 Tax=Sphaeroforma arctica JP610 TaxID=667725 RepID=A0A0L0G542_9EUKA|nr:hypothetical protein SARC_03608 [Sphaeroforma arctica JP610]KNC84152.1 hypothetical protein SARC_03608 [Sphaeroforma arctica JP610]|eukprot:XP_014158054.1 hypothetical protein SARC_03608 [Sphaeroforma arctica JP610]
MFSEAEKHDDMILQLPGNFEINTTFAGEIEEFAAAMATQLLPDHCREYETIVLGHGMWNVFKSSFAHVESHLRPALASLAEGCPGHIRNGRIFFLLMSSGTGQVGTRVRPRVYEWSRRVAAIVLEYNIKIVDTFHATDARLLDAGFNQSDGTHWGRIQSGNSTGTVGMSQILSLIQQLCPGQR